MNDLPVVFFSFHVGAKHLQFPSFWLGCWPGPESAHLPALLIEICEFKILVYSCLGNSLGQCDAKRRYGIGMACKINGNRIEILFDK